jgi:rhodanese-related sulfurtransferase
MSAGDARATGVNVPATGVDVPATGVDVMLARARARLARLDPTAAAEAAANGAVLVDIRPRDQRSREGEIPDALLIERNVLEWRFDPSHAARLPLAVDHDLQVIVFCSEGYTSSLAAASLHDIGLHRATDLDGGFVAWQAAGLPTIAGGRATDG